MNPRSPDPIRPTEGDSYSKGAVNRAARRVLEFYKARRPGDSFSPEELDEIVKALQTIEWWRSQHAAPLTKVAAALRYHVKKEDAYIDERVDVTQRLKRRATMIGKLDREPKMELARMGDIGGVRARLPDLAAVYAVSRRLKKNWTIVRTRDYIEDPGDLNYRAIHHIVKRDDRLVEVQLRTIRQDAWANNVEEDGRIGRINYKFGRGAIAVLDYYRAASDALFLMDRGESLDTETAKRLNDAYRLAKPLLTRTID